jgi:hypothetical protein
MSRVLIVIGSFIACFAGGSVHADEFAWELSAFAAESEAGPLVETDESALQATHFFDPVDDANGPYALASFFDPTSRLSVLLSHGKQTTRPDGFDPSPIVLPDAITKIDDYAVSGRYVLPQSRWYFGGSYTKSDIGTESSAEPDAEGSGYGLLVGKYLGSATTLEVALNSSELDSTFPIPFCPLGQPCVTVATATTEEQREHASVNVLHVRRARSMTYTLSGRIAGSRGRLAVAVPAVTLPPPVNLPIPAFDLQVSIPRLQSYSVAGELFPTQKLGVRLGYTRWDDDTPADDAYDVAVTWFVRRDLGLQLSYARQSVDDATMGIFTDFDFDNSDTTTIRVIGRF